MKVRTLLPVLILALSFSGYSLDPGEAPSVKRGEPQRQGNYWEEREECSAPLRAGSRMTVRADFGSIDVQPAAGERMTCQVRVRVYTANESDARRYFHNYELTLQPTEGGLFLKGSLPSERKNNPSLSAEFSLAVPARTNLDLETKGGAIEVGKLDGSLQAVTAGGDIRTADLAGPVRAETAGGSIRLGSVAAPVEARTAGGSILVGDVNGAAVLETSGGEVSAGMVAGTLRAETAGGDLVLRGAKGGIEARTAGGQIQIGETGGSVVAQTAGGSIRLQGARGRVEVKTAGGGINLLQVRNGVQASTAAGCILAQIDAGQKAFAASDLETMAGDILVYLPPNLPVTVDAAIDMAAGHKIMSDFPLNIKGDGQAFAPKRLRGEGALNGGGELLRVRTVAGNIEIRKLDTQTLGLLRSEQDSFWKRWQEREAQRQPKQAERQEPQ
jgi:DUF4097 and DUF4098 domain-containing protein YvlB